jgi:hypothetical protein
MTKIRNFLTLAAAVLGPSLRRDRNRGRPASLIRSAHP